MLSSYSRRKSTEDPKKHVTFKNSILDAVTQFDEGFEAYWNIMAAKICQDLIKSSELLNYINQLKSCTKVLNRKNERVVETILSVQWEKRELEVVVPYLNLLHEIVSANSIHMYIVLNHLFKKLKPSACSMVVEQDKVYELVLHSIDDIVEAIPESEHAVPLLISKHVPYDMLPISIHIAYFSNILQLSLYQPKFRKRVLEAIVSQIIEMDVKVSKEDIQEIENAKENITDTNQYFCKEVLQLFMPAKMIETSKNTDIKTFLHYRPPLLQGIVDHLRLGMYTTEYSVDEQQVKAMLWPEKIDILLEQLILYINHTVYKEDGSLLMDVANSLYNDLIKVFESAVLPTRDIKYAPYILFYFLSIKQSFCDKFIDYLWRKFQSFETPQVICQLSMAYLGSFLSRGKYVSLSTITAFLDSVVPWIHRYIDEKEQGDLDLSKSVMYGKFYSACQTVFYIIVFRHKQILDHSKGHNFIQNLNLAKVVTSPLNPLRFCQKAVADLFSKIMRQHQLVYCNAIIEQNRRNFIPATEEKPNPFESFFPFDPISLKRSSEHIDGIYQVWEEEIVHEVIEEDDGDDDDLEVTEELMKI